HSRVVGFPFVLSKLITSTRIVHSCGRGPKKHQQPSRKRYKPLTRVPRVRCAGFGPGIPWSKPVGERSSIGVTAGLPARATNGLSAYQASVSSDGKDCS